MNKKDIDQYITTHYDDLVLYARKMYNRHKKFDESEYALISGLYEYLILNLEKMKTEKDIKDFCSTFIYKNTYWNRGFTEKIQDQHRNKYINVDDYDFDLFDIINIEDEQYDNDEFEEKQAFIYYYYNTLKTMEEIAVWEIFFIEEKQTGKAFSEYIKLSTTVAHKYINWLKNDIREKYKIYKQNIDNYILDYRYKKEYLESPEKVLNKKLI